MTDIFLSYTESDRDTARRIAGVLGKTGWTVWWDRRIPAGETWRSVLEHALEDMRCMVVLWSARSIESEWVYEEASEGRRQGKLVPVVIEKVRPPAGFREIQAADLTGWDGSTDFEGLQMLLGDLESMLGKPLPAVKEDAPKREPPDDKAGPPYDPSDLAGGTITTPWWQQNRRPILAAVAALLTAGAIYLALSGRQPALAPPPVLEPERPDTRPDTAQVPAQPSPLPAPPLPATPTADSPPVANAVEKLPPKAHTASKHSEPVRTTSPHCADLLARVQLGESLSREAQAVFQKECQQ